MEFDLSVPDHCLFIYFFIVGFLLLWRFSVGLAAEYSSCFISVLNLDLYIYCFDALMS